MCVGNVLLLVGNRFMGQCHHAHTAQSQRFNLLVPIISIQGFGPICSELSLAQADEPIWRAFNGDFSFAAGAWVSRGHVTFFGFKGQGVQPWPLCFYVLSAQAVLSGQYMQGALGRVAVQVPLAVFMDHVGVVAKQCDTASGLQDRVALNGSGITAQCAFWRITLTALTVATVACDHGASGHSVGGQGAGLVGANHIDRSQNLHRGKRLTRACWRAIRSTPRARVMVTIAGSPSGIAATAIPIAPRNNSAGSDPCRKNPRATVSAVSNRMATVSCPAKTRN